MRIALLVRYLKRRAWPRRSETATCAETYPRGRAAAAGGRSRRIFTSSGRAAGGCGCPERRTVLVEQRCHRARASSAPGRAPTGAACRGQRGCRQGQYRGRAAHAKPSRTGPAGCPRGEGLEGACGTQDCAQRRRGGPRACSSSAPNKPRRSANGAMPTTKSRPN